MKFRILICVCCFILICPILILFKKILEQEETKENYCLIDMLDILRDIIPQVDNSEMNLYVLTNKQKIHGAYTILMESARKEIANSFDVKYVIALPSSTHEWIEANERIDKERREINLEMRQNGDYLYVKISNPLNGKLSIENGKIKTTKKDTIFHGFGLESIEEIAKKYSGSVTYKQKNDFFIAIVLFSNI